MSNRRLQNRMARSSVQIVQKATRSKHSNVETIIYRGASSSETIIESGKSTAVYSEASSQSTSIDNGKACPECFKVISCRNAQSIHMLTHTLEKLFHCEKCQKCLSTGYILKIHVREMHNKVII
ncbi:hypothetical protein LOTGIDRAFT_155351 [Lottia gigantea]|uniref:C2H2-type domain-containing protein n=1 Tax=Lottia gigantea TaxID=225164 RepID=V3ZIJ1_LOTGI|nr:hypothetical protein LOTGIDRAFT_155351 [Lottia gigantea]ESO84037.1 hypothetical protein LOTGIDRAFT_155351 [Lottia gigantea]